MKFGRKGIKLDYRTLRFATYATSSLPPPAPAADQFARAMATTGDASFGDLFPMDGNDELGDCTIAGLAHMVTLFEGMVGRGFIPAPVDVEAVYRTLTDGLDTGLYCIDVLNYIMQTAVLGGDKIMGYAAIDPKNHDHVKQAIMLFGGVYLGFQVQGGAIPDFQARRPWDASSNMTSDGHCVVAGGYDDGTGLVRLATWGNDQLATWAWWDQCVDEVYAVLPREAADPAFAPGFDLAHLAGDLIAVRGSA